MVAVPALEGQVDLMRDAQATRYLTRMTMQGDNLGSTVGVFGDESVYIEGTLRMSSSRLPTSSGSRASETCFRVAAFGLLFRCFVPQYSICKAYQQRDDFACTIPATATSEQAAGIRSFCESWMPCHMLFCSSRRSEARHTACSVL